jgi:hypothetical protein
LAEENPIAGDAIKIIRRARRDISAEFGHDVDRVVDYYRSVEEELRHTGRFRFDARIADAKQRDVDEPSTGALTVTKPDAAAT